MRIACSTICFGNAAVDDALEHIADSGFDLIDLAAVPLIFPHVQLTDDPPADQPERLAKRLAELGLAVNGVNSVPWIPDALDDPQELRRRYTICADVAAAV